MVKLLNGNPVLHGLLFKDRMVIQPSEKQMNPLDRQKICWGRKKQKVD